MPHAFYLQMRIVLFFFLNDPFIMKLFIALLATLTFSFSPLQKEEEVFICVSATAHVYHARKYCRGLDACTHTIKKVTVSVAKNEYKRRACKVCY